MTSDLIESVKNKLRSYNLDEVEQGLLEDSIDTAVQKILNFCNLSELPVELEYVAVNIACGEIMYLAAICNSDESTERAVASIKEGDTQVTFATEATPVQRKDALITKLRTLPYDELIRFRRLKW